MTTIRDSFRIARGSYQPNFDHWTADRHGDLCRLGEHMERVGMDCRRRPIPCASPRCVAVHGAGPPRPEWKPAALANGFTTPRIGANQFLRRTVNAQTNPWQNISIASAISSSRTRRISAALGPGHRCA
jgi:hypothetical protein